MNKAKTKPKFRVAWENDIPICLGVQSDYQWQELPWKQIEKRVHKLQKRIYQASKRGDVKVVRKLQNPNQVLERQMSCSTPNNPR